MTTPNHQAQRIAEDYRRERWYLLKLAGALIGIMAVGAWIVWVAAGWVER
jgi:hypothetical protein